SWPATSDKLRAMLSALALLLLSATAWGQDAPGLEPAEGDYTVHDFTFKSGEKLGELRLHYTTLGHPMRDAGRHVSNAVLIMPGTGGSGRPFLRPGFGGVLFGRGQLLDANRYYIILPDAIGH